MIFSKIRAFWAIFEFCISVLIVIILMYIFNKHNRKIRQIWAKSQSFLLGYKIKYDGEISQNAKLLVLNHQSIVDIIALEDIHPANLCWIGKKEITNTPIFGHIMKAPPMISVDREDKRSLLKLLKDVKLRVSENRVVPIFPEGTRGDGKKLLKFKSGAKLLAQKLELIVQPAVIIGSIDAFNSKKLTSKKTTILVKFLPEINPKDDENWYENLEKNMQKVLDDELANLSSNS